MVSQIRIPGLGAYAATKAAPNMLFDTARVELAEDNVGVITVYPQRMRQHQRTSASPAKAIDTPERVAEKILLVAQEEPDEQFMDSSFSP